MATSEPAQATRLTLKMLEDAANDWGHLGWRAQVRDILAATSDAVDQATIDNRDAIIDYYIKHGERDSRAFASRQP